MTSVSPGIIHGQPLRGESIVDDEQYADISEMYMAQFVPGTPSPAKGSEL